MPPQIADEKSSYVKLVNLQMLLFLSLFVRLSIPFLKLTCLSILNEDLNQSISAGRINYNRVMLLLYV